MEVKLKINRIANDGEGISRYQNKPVFVYGALPGEEILCDIRLNKRHVYEGNLIEVLEKSPKRVDMPSDNKNETVSLTLAHLNYFDTLVYKRETVSFMLNTRLRKETKKTIIENTVPSDKEYNYRNETLVPVLNKRKKLFWGLYNTGSNIVLETKRHYSQDELLNDTLNKLLIIFENNGVNAFDKKVNNGILRAIKLRVNDKREVSVTLITYDYFDFKKLVDNIIVEMSYISKIGVLENKDLKNRNLLIGKYELIYGDKYFNMEIGGRNFLLSYNSFFQLNTSQTKKLYDLILKEANFKGDEIVLDAYSGVGTIGMYISNFVKQVYSIEQINEATDANIEALKLNNIKNVKPITADVVKWVKYNKQKFDMMIFDPPRTGLGEKVTKFILKEKPKKVIYVSCDIETLVEDLKVLSEKYNILKVIPLDMFPHTAHVETVCSLSLKK